MGVIHKKGCPQDNVGANHSHDLDNDLLLSKHVPNPWVLPKASCSIPTKSETIADHGKEEGEGKTIDHASRLLCLAPFRCLHLLLHRSVPAYGPEEK